jgi:hydrogenase maturation protease
MSEPARATLVLGLGNPIMADDGVGIAAIERLRTGWELPPGVELMDGGTWGMNLLPAIEAAGRLILVDAIDAGAAPGADVTLERAELPRMLRARLSTHQVDLLDVLAIADLRGGLPVDTVALGLQPGRVEMSTEMSPPVRAGMDRLVERVAARLAEWGEPCRRRGAADA